MVSLVDPKYWEKWSNSNLSEIQNTNSEQRDKNEKEKNNKLTHVILYCDPLCYIFIGMDKYISYIYIGVMDDKPQFQFELSLAQFSPSLFYQISAPW